MFVEINYVLISIYQSYKNRVSTHFVIFPNFPCLIACLLCCLLMSFFFSFLLVLWLGICVEEDVDRITILPSLPPYFFFVPTHNFLFNTSGSYLKSVRAQSWFRCRLAVYFQILVTLRKVSWRRSRKALRWDKVITICRVCIVQYRISLKTESLDNAILAF